ncbi:ComGF family competence protein [Macrococcus equipercicus]|uniref:ComGF family competence protein n=1 Tax=Macrococcus equipercicus TaxID=69967 RepID=A0A9Q9BRT4_9STAP|nr:ComGF family competence protein [Macrococcus equipercicus]KAA1040114.1 hypothetical protein ERX35_003755 [Macrococcus equipercicus]UTH12939.1 ComGF family competence protein [Macrococcus equipercicus]
MNKEAHYAAKILRQCAFRGDDAFTLLEMLLNFSIALVICALFPLIIQNIKMFQSIASDNYDINFELCLRDILSEIEGKEVTVIDGDLAAKDTASGKRYSYMYHQGRIVRTLNQTGYVILLEQVRQARFYEQSGHIFLAVKWHDARRVKNEIVQIT